MKKMKKGLGLFMALAALMLCTNFHVIFAAEGELPENDGFDIVLKEETFSGETHIMDVSGGTAEIENGMLKIVPDANQVETFVLMKAAEKVDDSRAQFEKIELTVNPVIQCPITVTALTWSNLRHLIALRDGKLYDNTNTSGGLKYKATGDAIAYADGEELKFTFYLWCDETANQDGKYNTKYSAFVNGREIELLNDEFIGSNGFNHSWGANRLRVTTGIPANCPEGRAVYIDDIRFSTHNRSFVRENTVGSDSFSDVDISKIDNYSEFASDESETDKPALTAEKGMTKITRTTAGVINWKYTNSDSAYPDNVSKKVLKLRFKTNEWSNFNGAVIKISNGSNSYVSVAKLTSNTMRILEDYTAASGTTGQISGVNWGADTTHEFTLEFENGKLTGTFDGITRVYDSNSTFYKNLGDISALNLSKIYIYLPSGTGSFYIDDISWSYSEDSEFDSVKIADNRRIVFWNMKPDATESETLYLVSAQYDHPESMLLNMNSREIAADGTSNAWIEYYTDVRTKLYVFENLNNIMPLHAVVYDINLE